MRELTIWDRLKDWFEFLPLRVAYRLVWLSAKSGSRTGIDVYNAMWEANLSLPILGKNESNSK